MHWWLVILFLVQPVSGFTDYWDMPPIRYSDTPATDTLSKLAADLASGARRIEGKNELERLQFVLDELNIPEQSQVLVFSKTSHQNPLIHPENPRSLYYSENAYVGFVPGGDIEAIVQDPLLGPVYYLIKSGGRVIERDLTTCISCHATTNTEHVPGMLVRSVFPDENGHPLLAMGTSLVKHDTPLSERWGGYYVTGRSSLPHLGNRTYQEAGPPDPMPSDLKDLNGIINVRKYLRPTSDIVALMVLEHQCHMHNLLNAATMQYRRACYMSRTLNPDENPNSGSAGIVAEAMADKITACLLFKDEANPGEDIQGGDEFQKVFEARYPRTRDGRSLADFRLYGRLFKHSCSYMVYSEAFRNLPVQVKLNVFKKLKSAFTGKDPAYDWINATEGQKIDGILTETLPEWRDQATKLTSKASPNPLPDDRKALENKDHPESPGPADPR